MIRASNVTLKFGDTLLLHNISFSVRGGELLMVLGANGAGKSSLVKTTIGIYTPTSGTVQRGVQKIGYVPQKLFLNSGLTVLELMRYFGALKGCMASEALRVLDFVGLDSYRDYLIKELSGGSRQKLVLAQALLGRPELLVLDEPFVGLDQDAVSSMVILLQQFLGDGGTVILTTHVFHQVFAENAQVAVLKGGRLSSIGTFDEMSKRVCLRIRRRPGLPALTLLDGLYPAMRVTETGQWLDIVCNKTDRLQILNQLAAGHVLLDWVEEHLWNEDAAETHSTQRSFETNTASLPQTWRENG